MKRIGAGSTIELRRELRGSELWRECPLGGIEDVVVLEDDFLHYATGGLWTSALTGTSTTGTAAAGDAAGGQLVLTSKAEDNMLSAANTTNEVFKIALNKPLWFEALVKLTEGNTDDANVFVGLSDTLPVPQDDGGGPPSSWDGLGFFKVDGGTKWQFETSKTTSQETTEDVGTRTSGSWVRLGFKVMPDANGTTATVTAYVNGVAVAVHTISVASMGEMHVSLCVKSGGATAEVLTVDWVRVVQVR